MNLYVENLREIQKNKYILKTKVLITYKLLEVFIKKMPHC